MSLVATDVRQSLAEYIAAAGGSPVTSEWIKHHLYEDDLKDVNDQVRSFTRDEMKDFIFLLDARTKQFTEWINIIEHNYRETRFLSEVLRVARHLLDREELRSDAFGKELDLAILGYRRESKLSGQFSPSEARGTMIERILTNGIDVEKVSPEYFRWLDDNHVAIGKHLPLLRSRGIFTVDFIMELVDSKCPSALGAGIL